MKKFLSTILCFVIIVGCFAVIPVGALTYPAMAEISSSSGVASIYSLPGTTGHETAENKNQSQKVDTLANGTQVKVLGIENDGDGDPWYKINYGENFSKSGYAFVNRVVVKYEYTFDENFEENLKYFPESYHSALRQLHAQYPNWKFVANNLDLTFKEAVEAQYGVDDVKNTRKWVEFTYGNNKWRDMRAYDSTTDKWITLESRWTYASREAIEYFMDPRNSLNEDMIFAFMQQSYVEDAKTQDNLRAVIKGTFLEKGYDKNGDGTPEKDAYIEDLIAAAKESRVSAYVLAATIIVEQGVGGTSNLISGTYAGYENCYNFFNFSAAGSTEKEIIENGLKYAKNNGWNSRTAAIIGGAQKYADGYISVGQDTYYYKDFNVLKEYWSHQYASALYDAWTNAAYLKKGCVTNTNTVLTFSIPVYKDMPELPCIIPSAIIETSTGRYMWRLIGTTLIISGEGNMGLESPWLDSGVEITDVVIENGITSIGDYAFSHCESLTNISIPHSVTSIGDYSFADCNGLENISIPNSVTSIGTQAFYFCTSLKNLSIPDSVTIINDMAFYGCWSLESIRLPKNLKNINSMTLSNCEGLKSVIIPDSVTTIWHDAFNSCLKIADVWYMGSQSDKESIFINSGNGNLISAKWHYNTCDLDEHIYSGPCDSNCNNCEWVRVTNVEHTNTDSDDTVCDVCGTKIEHIHTYDNACDAICNICTEIREVPDHIYDHIYDIECNECGAVREATPLEWEISVSKTGVYTLKPNSKYTGAFSTNKIIVSDKNGNVVKYNESKGGFPLVADQDYIVKFNYDCSDDINGTVTWTKTRKADTIFTDVSSSEWYNEAVTYSVGRGIISGYGGTTKFGPGDNIQRQDFLVILARLDGVDLTIYGNKKSAFPDVPEGSYYEAAVNWGVEKGIVSGYQNGKFGTGDKITREQLVTFLYRYANYKGINTSYTTTQKNKVKNTYTDYKNVTDYAQDPVIWAVTNSVINGKTPTTIVPGGNALRCEVAQIMYNIFNNDIF